MECLADAAELAGYYLDEAVRLTDAAAIDPFIKLPDQLWRWLLNRPGDLIRLSTVYQTGQPKSLRTAKAARETMAILTANGCLIPLEGGAVIEGKRHKEAWQIARVKGA